MAPDAIRDLWRAVVAQAVRDLLYPEVEKPTTEERIEAYNWIMSSATGVQSYLWVCDEADLHPDVARRTLSEAGIR